MGIDRYDQEIHPRCPPLGGEVPFYHCRRVNRGLPCHRIVLCWADRVDIASFIRENYSQEEIEAMSRPPESRLAVMLETAQRVKKEQGG
ncbi:MAG: hypothetical protein GXP50_09590 [Deltaproteobacteria bacterium]|nr:hypothetical protein [Deltaproteobacteria bacterium]